MLGVFASSSVPLTNCEPPFSFFFDLVRPLWAGGNHSPLHRVCTLMRKMGARSFLREDLVNFAEFDSEIAAAELRCAGTVNGAAVRFTFFRNCPNSMSWKDLADQDILGYAIVATLALPDTTRRTYILEAVIRLPAVWLHEQSGTVAVPLTNHYVHCCREFETSVGTPSDNRTFKYTGTFFCQQNSLTHVCAHAALRTAVNSSPQRPPHKLTNADINAALNIDHQNKIVGTYSSDPANLAAQGLTAPQIITVAKSLGFEVHFGDFEANPDIKYNEYIYPLEAHLR